MPTIFTFFTHLNTVPPELEEHLQVVRNIRSYTKSARALQIPYNRKDTSFKYQMETTTVMQILSTWGLHVTDGVKDDLKLEANQMYLRFSFRYQDAAIRFSDNLLKLDSQKNRSSNHAVPKKLVKDDPRFHPAAQKLCYYVGSVDLETIVLNKKGKIQQTPINWANPKHRHQSPIKNLSQ